MKMGNKGAQMKFSRTWLHAKIPCLRNKISCAQKIISSASDFVFLRMELGFTGYGCGRKSLITDSITTSLKKYADDFLKTCA
jgi:hypothetical protein